VDLDRPDAIDDLLGDVEGTGGGPGPDLGLRTEREAPSPQPLAGIVFLLTVALVCWWSTGMGLPGWAALATFAVVGVGGFRLFLSPPRWRRPSA
jgi:hypothetical protein